MKKSLQEIADPDGVCYGCGQSNPHGLHLKSYPEEDGIHYAAVIQPEDYYCGWPGLVYGGFIAMIVDCHSNWTAMSAHYRAEGREPGSLPKINCVTGRLALRYRKATPMGVPLRLRSWVEGDVSRGTIIKCEVYAGSELTVTAESLFIRVNTEELAENAVSTRISEGG